MFDFDEMNDMKSVMFLLWMSRSVVVCFLVPLLSSVRFFFDSMDFVHNMMFFVLLRCFVEHSQGWKSKL